VYNFAQGGNTMVNIEGPLHFIPNAILDMLDPTIRRRKCDAAYARVAGKNPGIWIDAERDTRIGMVLADQPPKTMPATPASHLSRVVSLALPYGLGTVIRKGIDVTTFGFGKAIAERFAKAFTKRPNCGCAARAKCLDELMPDVRVFAGMSWVERAGLLPGIWKCMRAKDDPETVPTDLQLN